MKVNDRFHKGPVQDLLNAVVVQAAVDYREYSAKLLVHPDDTEVAEGKEEVESFFLSEDFCFYTRVGGDYILNKLKEEISVFDKTYKDYRKTENELEHEARHAARLLMQKQKLEADAEETGRKFSAAEVKIHDLIRSMREQQMKMPAYAKKILKYPTFETVMYQAYSQLQEAILNGKESLWD